MGGRWMNFYADLPDYDPNARRLTDRDVLRRFGGLLYPYRRRMVLAFLLVMVVSGMMMAQPWLIQVAIDHGIGTDERPGSLGILNATALAFIASLIVFWAASYAQTYLLSWIGQRVLLDIRRRLFTHLQSLSLRYYDRTAVGEVISRQTSDVNALNEVLTQGLTSTIADFVLLVGTIAIMASMSWKLTLVTFTVLPVMYVIARLFARYGRNAYRRLRLAVADMNSNLAENIVGMRIVQAFRREERNAAHFDIVNDYNLQATYATIGPHAGIFPVTDLLDAAATVLVLWVGGQWLLGDAASELTIGVLTAFMLFITRFFRADPGPHDAIRRAASGHGRGRAHFRPPGDQDRGCGSARRQQTAGDTGAHRVRSRAVRLPPPGTRLRGLVVHGQSWRPLRLRRAHRGRQEHDYPATDALLRRGQRRRAD